MLSHLSVPDELQRNSPGVAAAGYEETGAHLIQLATERAGLTTLADTDVLDIGCGVRFTQTIINRRIPIRSYTGIEVYRPIVTFMKRRVEPFDARFRFIHWDVRHDIYNRRGFQLVSGCDALPVDQQFDLIWLFSVFTHLDEKEAAAMLRLVRRVIRPGGTLLFTAFVDAGLDGVDCRGPRHRLETVFYGRPTMDRLLRETGWRTNAFYARGAEPFIQPCFVCAPDATCVQA